jgi:peptidylprolyl isomerase
VVVVVLLLLFVLLFNRQSPRDQTATSATAQVAAVTSEAAILRATLTAPTATVLAAPTSAAAAAGPTAAAVAPKKTYSAAPPMTIDPKKSYIATITTPRGDIVVKLRPDLAPETVNSFVFLSREGFYDGLTWHRVIPGFVAQGGDPEGSGLGGPGYTVKGEFTDKVLFDKPGILAMARPGNDVNGNGSQFYITLAPTPNLNNQYTIFGEVTQGQEIVNGIPERDPSSATTPGEQIVKITITEQ